MAVKNRPVIGYVTCNSCGKEASVHQVMSGTRKGALYTRFCDCGTNQSQGDFLQNYWRENTRPLPEYADLFPGSSNIEPGQDNPADTNDSGYVKENQDENAESQEDIGSEGQSIPEDNQKPRSKTPLVIGGVLLLVSGLAAAFGLKK